MFNSYTQNATSNQSIKINAVSGAILKNHPKSWFVRFNLKSELAKELLKEGGHKAKKSHFEDTGYGPYRHRKVWEDDTDNDIIILQMMLCGDMEVIAECVHRIDFECVDNNGKPK